MNAPRGDAPTEVAEPIVGEDVLVAARDVAQGAALTAADLRVVRFPADSVSQNFVRVSGKPSARDEYVGAVARRSFVAGEPIVAGSVVQPDGRGFMAAIVEPGYRGVAIEIESSTAAAGYIQPNDHVDIIVTMKIDSGQGEQVRSEIILEDVRVLAIGEKTQAQSSGEAPEVVESEVALLELTASDARTLAHANELGDISLALRSVQADVVGMTTRRANPLSQESEAVRVHAFGTVSGGGR
jgi:pilus assembly protein CpaB